MLQIKRFSDGDALACCRIAKANWKYFLSNEYDEKTAKKFINAISCKNLESNRKNIWVMKKDGRVVGFCLEKHGIIKRLHIAPKFHRMGYGTRLVRFIQKRKSGLIVVSSFSAVPFYEKNGFRKVARLKFGIFMIWSRSKFA
ncbi:MAG: GNAT family N-acetyltransferase [Candidatus Altiarchaeota archaeon]